ncbi:synaptic vesicle glycoprotein 2Ca isoform X3 [Hemiscyllium ocellatum]|uniref:synaptic vesicle glycoprotein 2Ca isoform X3 n=1 Tax=Hemiscyllium ocellatum TaxID=170820 RepID=UPI002966D6AA|nr:synaptic vesicle glycoprotein 2Ca isoform X3 [Hemiscyllium ocellatum]
MDDAYRDRTTLMRGAKDIAKEVKKQTVKKASKGADHDEYNQTSYVNFQDDEHYNYRGESYGEEPHEDEGSSDATEGHDEEDEIYEGEYQGIPDMGQRKENQVAIGQPVSDEYKDREELDAERRADEEELAQQYELIIQECGHGRFQWALFFVLGLSLMADGVEVFVVGFVLPSAETDMCVENSTTGWLGSIVYLGMMLGAFFWGGLADKVGRRQALIICMSVNGFFAFLSSFVQGYGLFLFCRFFAGFGIGGAVPVVFSYFAEVLAREKRGEHLSWLCMFWMIGGIYASAMAWAIIPHYGWSFSMGSAYQFHSWRVFVVVCALPCVSSVVALTFMPESPRFLLEVGKHDEAWMILKQIHDTNMRARGQPEKVFTVNRIKTPKLIDELIEIQTDTGTWYKRWFVRIKTELYSIWMTFMRCFDYPVKKNTIMLIIVWTTLSFGYYGLSVWFPDVIKHLQADEYASRVKRFYGERVVDFVFNFTLENQIHTNGEYIRDRFTIMKFKAVTFEDSLFKNCYFEDVTSLSTYFRNCTFNETLFYNTGGSMVLSGISCFFLWFGTSEAMMIGMLCLYNGLTISAWNSLDVITVELLPTDRRATGFGFLNALCKAATVLGNLIFGSLVGITKAIPILLASTVLVCGGLMGLRLPDTRNQVLM